MNSKSFTCETTLQASPEKLFQALTKEVSQWWTTHADDASSVDTEATFRFGETYNTMRVNQLVPNQTVVWECIVQNHVNDDLSVNDEWVGTTLHWNIEQTNDGCKLSFIHEGLVPELECYEICDAGWTHFILTSLKKYVETGTGEPFSQ